MKDTEIRELVQDLASVGLSEDPSVIESSQDGIISINLRDVLLESIYLLKRASYQRVDVESTVCWFVFADCSYVIRCKTKEDAKKVAKKIQNFLNS